MSKPTPAPPPPISGAANDVAPEPSHAQWSEIVQQLGAEIAGPLSAALERINNLMTTGQIDRQGLRTLRESVAQAREAGMLGQQLARLASGRLRLTRERLQIAQMLRGVLAQRSRDTQARGIQVRQSLKPIEVMADAALMFSLLNAMMDWALATTHSSIDLRLDMTPWPAKARLSCRFAHRPLDLIDNRRNAPPPPRGLDSLAWRLVEQTALTMGVLPLREDEAGITTLTLEFPQPAGEEQGLGAETVIERGVDRGLERGIERHAERHNERHSERRPEFAPSTSSKPLAGSHLLMVSPRRSLHDELIAAVRHMGLIVDVVPTIGEAVQFCREGLPHGMVFESAQRGPAFDQLRKELLLEAPEFSFVEVIDSEHLTQLSTATVDGIARISRQHLADALPSVLLFELSKSL